MLWLSLWFTASHNTLKAPWSECSPGSLMLPDIRDGIGFWFFVCLFFCFGFSEQHSCRQTMLHSCRSFSYVWEGNHCVIIVLYHIVLFPSPPQIACSSLYTHHQSTRATPSIENTGIRILVFTSLVATPVMTMEVKTQLAEQSLVR